MNSVHKRALKFTYDVKGKKLNDFAPPNMKAYYRSLKSCFALSLFSCDSQICNNADYFFTSKRSYCLKKSNSNHLNIIG